MAAQAKNVTVETITPKLAEKWLAMNTENRPMSPRHVKLLAKQIREGRWQLNYETIKFDENGRLMDGQHRLKAIMEADRAVRSAVAREVDTQAFSTIDTGRRRMGNDVLAIAGEANCSTLAAALRIVLIYEVLGTYDSSVGLVSNDDLLQTLEEHPGIRDWVSRSLRGRHLLEGSMSAGFGYLFAQKSKEKAEAFFDALETGVDLKEGSPVLLLRERLASNRAARARLARREIAALVVKAWNEFREGKKIKRLLWNGQDGEPFPKIK